MKSLSIQSLSALSVAFLSLTLATGCGSTGNVVGKGPSKTDTRAVAGFTSVLADETADVIAVIGPLKPIQITADENIVPIITTKVEGNTLIISSSRSYQTKNPVKVMIQAPNIDTITTRGSGDVTLKPPLSIRSPCPPPAQVTLPRPATAKPSTLNQPDPVTSAPRT
jgi:Putative auto-transporter adhesin, head GIN domain